MISPRARAAALLLALTTLAGCSTATPQPASSPSPSPSRPALLTRAAAPPSPTGPPPFTVTGEAATAAMTSAMHDAGEPGQADTALNFCGWGEAETVSLDYSRWTVVNRNWEGAADRLPTSLYVYIAKSPAVDAAFPFIQAVRGKCPAESTGGLIHMQNTVADTSLRQWTGLRNRAVEASAAIDGRPGGMQALLLARGGVLVEVAVTARSSSNRDLDAAGKTADALLKSLLDGLDLVGR